MKPISDVRDAVSLIGTFTGPVSEFALCLAESVHDPIGVNVAIVTDHVLARGWEPLSVERHDGYRIYRYKEAC